MGRPSNPVETIGNGGLAVNRDPRRDLPSVDRLAGAVCTAFPEIPAWAATEGARSAVEGARARLSALPQGASFELPTHDALIDEAASSARLLSRPHPRRVINATGIVLHTNLGRAPMAEGAAQAAALAAARPSSLEFDVETGRRGQRLGPLDAKLSRLAGAEAGFACNNGAAAVLLGLSSLAAGREVVVSRGELVEIGGSFRVPEIMEKAGVRLVEVGSTNRTHLRDYERAIGPDTALLLKVHRSNFEQRGFVKEVALSELVALGRAHGLPVMEDLGSGTLFDLTPHGFPLETSVAARVATGVDVVCFSGDKLMGGPQAGLALGRRTVIDAMRADPLARALRLDAMTLAALDWTLDAMLEGRAEQALPAVAQLLAAPDALDRRARALAGRVGDARPEVSIEVIDDRAPVGGGSLPGFELTSRVLEVRGGPPADELARRLRARSTPVVARVRDDALRVDLRTVFEDEVETLIDALVDALGTPASSPPESDAIGTPAASLSGGDA